MSLEARLRQGFDKATRSTPQTVDAALGDVIAMYRLQRRHRAMLLAVAAATAIVAFLAGDNAVQWVQGLERRSSPAEDGRLDDIKDRDRASEQMQETRAHRTRVRRPGDQSSMASFVPKAGVRTDRDRVRVPDVRAIARPGAIGGAYGPCCSSSERDRRGAFTRRETQDWDPESYGPDGAKTGFSIAEDERFVRIHLRYTGGGGFSGMNAVLGEVYEIVDGRYRFLSRFCEDSGDVRVTSGAEIEVRAFPQGCDGTHVGLKGEVTVRFYR